MKLLDHVFGTYSERQIKKIEPIAEQIENLQDVYRSLTDAELQHKTQEFRARLQEGATLNDLLPEAFATVREADARVLGLRPFHVQLIGGILLHQGRIAEMKTGEGKTLVATMPAYLNALTGNGVHVITVNDYLAKRDAEEMGLVYKFLGLTVGLVTHDQSREEKKAAYLADITYGIDTEFGFDYLRDNLATSLSQVCQRGHAFAIVDEVDSVLIDEARTPLIISGPGEDPSPLYAKADAFVRTLRPKYIREAQEDTDMGDDVFLPKKAFQKASAEDYSHIKEDYIVDEKNRTTSLSQNGLSKAEQFFHVSFDDPEQVQETGELMSFIQQAMQAHGVMMRDRDYIVRDGRILIVDQFTGRVLPGRRFNGGLHQALETKEHVDVQNESITHATITYQNYFRLYKKLSGMTGTALTEEAEFRDIYSLDSVEVQTNKPVIRIDHPDIIFATKKSKDHAILEQIKECYEKGQPVLIGTVTVERSDELSRMLKKAGIPHEVLNAKQHEREAHIIARAGCFKSVTIATNMAGRGTDIMLGGNPEGMAKAQMQEEEFTPELIQESTSTTITDDETILQARKRFLELKEEFAQKIQENKDLVLAAGGLFVLGTERHESRRIDNQLRGRSGRQGDPGESRFYLSLEDDLLHRFGSDALLNMAQMVPEDTPIVSSKFISSAIEMAQRKKESINFQARKNILSYDDVLNQQRQLVYKERNEVLQGADLHDKICQMIREYLQGAMEKILDVEPTDEQIGELQGLFKPYLPQDMPTPFDKAPTPTFEEDVIACILEGYEKKKASYPPELFQQMERIILLNAVDRKWIEYVDATEELKTYIALHSYAGRSPLDMFRLETSNMLCDMSDGVREETAKNALIARIGIKQPQVRDFSKKLQAHLAQEDADLSTPRKSSNPTPRKNQSAPVHVRVPAGDNRSSVGPYDPCPCGSGKKYKFCCMKKGS